MADRDAIFLERGGIGTYIQESRLSARETKKKTAESGGIAVRRLTQIERGELAPAVDVLWRIVRFLDMRPREAFRCAGILGASELPAQFDAHAKTLSATQLRQISVFLRSR